MGGGKGTAPSFGLTCLDEINSALARLLHSIGCDVQTSYGANAGRHRRGPGEFRPPPDLKQMQRPVCEQK
eukprot:7375052-Pyramimonas_sp.AAC.1